MVDSLIIPLLKIAITLNAVLIAVTYMVLLERKVIAWVQVRLGPSATAQSTPCCPFAGAQDCRGVGV